MSWVGGTITAKRRAVVAAVVIGIKQNFGSKFPQICACVELVFRVATLTDEVTAFLRIQRRSCEGRACIIDYSQIGWRKSFEQYEMRFGVQPLLRNAHICGSSSMVEYQISTLVVAVSSTVYRSIPKASGDS